MASTSPQTLNMRYELISRQAAMTKTCRKAGRHARNRVQEHQNKVFLER